ncbi:hypothetical protein RND71_037017 [Anisodus tanguticus]|uniref:Uncharacterized protein n=1 Tax=Anisodus tanguticus TaxID=243964 RepID=A0AAE1R2Y3_9SOLA|nr:hypothetical protein RND71_037017 [Anisodus tanguticus]
MRCLLKYATAFQRMMHHISSGKNFGHENAARMRSQTPDAIAFCLIEPFPRRHYNPSQWSEVKLSLNEILAMIGQSRGRRERQRNTCGPRGVDPCGEAVYYSLTGYMMIDLTTGFEDLARPATTTMPTQSGASSSSASTSIVAGSTTSGTPHTTSAEPLQGVRPPYVADF